MSLGTDKDEDDIALAGEYVLRVLSPEDQAAFEARLRDEPALRRIVANWEADLVTLTDAVSPVAVPPEVLDRIEERLFPVSAPDTMGRRPFWRSWGGALASLAVVVAVAAFVLDRTSVVGPAYQAEIAAEDASLVVAARFAPEDGVLNVTRLAGGPRPGRTLELWLIADGAAAPVSLGLIEMASVDIPLPEGLQAGLAGGVLAISDEPLGGSLTGAPTGDVLALGSISAI